MNTINATTPANGGRFDRIGVAIVVASLGASGAASAEDAKVQAFSVPLDSTEQLRDAEVPLDVVLPVQIHELLKLGEDSHALAAREFADVLAERVRSHPLVRHVEIEEREDIEGDWQTIIVRLLPIDEDDRTVDTLYDFCDELSVETGQYSDPLVIATVG